MQGGTGGGSGGHGPRQNFQGGSAGGNGGGPAANFQYRPPQRQFNQGNFQHNQYRGQNYNQFSGRNANFQRQNQGGYGNQSYGNQSLGNQRDSVRQTNNQQFNNRQTSAPAETARTTASGGQHQNNLQYVEKMATSSGGESTAAQKEIVAVTGTNGATVKLHCTRCGEVGDHIKKSCKADVLCVNCDKDSHISSKCAWLHQRKPVATFVGFGGEGLGCFVAEHTKETTSGSKAVATALIKIKEGSTESVTAAMLELGLGSTYPWRWAWKAKEVAAGAFLVNFPSIARITEAEIYDWVPLKKANIMVNVKLWTDESLAAGKLTTVWVKAKGVPKILKNFHGLCEIGSTLGQHIEADMEKLRKIGQVRLKIGVVNHLKIPKWTQISTPKLHFYRIYFQLEEVVELGWDRPEEDFLHDFEDVMDSQPEGDIERDPKRQKNIDHAAPSPSGQMVDMGKNIVASTQTRIALEQREMDLRKQDEEDVRLNSLKTGKSLFPNQGNEKTLTLTDKTGDTNMEGVEPKKSEEERVRLSDDDEDFEASQNSSFGDRVRAYLPGEKQAVEDPINSQGTVDDMGPRCSGRLASKNPEDMPVKQRAKSIKRPRT